MFSRVFVGRGRRCDEFVGLFPVGKSGFKFYGRNWKNKKYPRVAILGTIPTNDYRSWFDKP